MEEKIDRLKGKAKETLGEVTDDSALEAEGRADQAGATVKEKLEEVKDKLADAVDAVKDKLADARDKK
ncbi:MAG: CsbD family protein [Acidimicrobiia bacterium]